MLKGTAIQTTFLIYGLALLVLADHLGFPTPGILHFGEEGTLNVISIGFLSGLAAHATLWVARKLRIALRGQPDRG